MFHGLACSIKLGVGKLMGEHRKSAWFLSAFPTSRVYPSIIYDIL